MHADATATSNETSTPLLKKGNGEPEQQAKASDNANREGRKDKKRSTRKTSTTSPEKPMRNENEDQRIARIEAEKTRQLAAIKVLMAKAAQPPAPARPRRNRPMRSPSPKPTGAHRKVADVLRVRVPRSIVRGKVSVACLYCTAPAPACVLHFPAGRWRCAVCSRFGRITHDRRLADSKAHLTLELSPDSLPCEA